MDPDLELSTSIENIRRTVEDGGSQLAAGTRMKEFLMWLKKTFPELDAPPEDPNALSDEILR